MVVDDHPVNLEVLVRELELLGVSSETAVDGNEALKAWSTKPYAAVLADIHMPHMDGYELTRRLRAIEAEQHSHIRTPVVAVTALIDVPASLYCPRRVYAGALRHLFLRNLVRS